MPKPVSKRQARFMHAILSGKADPAKAGGRGVPPKSVAGKYAGHSTKDLPEQSGENRGGTWGEKHHAKAKDKVKSKRDERKADKKAKKQKGAERKKALKKAFEQYYKGKGAGVIVSDGNGKILIGEDASDGKLLFPGGHVDPCETHKEGAHRELREEAGLVAIELHEINDFRDSGNDCKTFYCDKYKGKLKPQRDEVKNLRFVEPHLIADDDRLRDCCKIGLKAYLDSHFCHMKKSDLKYMLSVEKLEKNIKRTTMGQGEGVLEVSHGDALRLVGNGAFRMIRNAVKDMSDEGFKEIKFDHYKISIRKHVSDMYSGRIEDGHKVIHQFTNKSLPQLTAELMSVFEWYLPEDEPELQILAEEHLSDDAIHGGLNTLLDNHKRHNIANIYQEVENIREEIRNGMAVDLQSVEKKIMGLFDKLEDAVQNLADKHNKLNEDAGNDIDKLEAKLLQLQNKVDELSSAPISVEAKTARPQASKKLLENDYCYLSRPNIEISPNGKIKITFSQDWNHMDQENFLRDMKARVIKKTREVDLDD